MTRQERMKVTRKGETMLRGIMKDQETDKYRKATGQNPDAKGRTKIMARVHKRMSEEIVSEINDLATQRTNNIAKRQAAQQSLQKSASHNKARGAQVQAAADARKAEGEAQKAAEKDRENMKNEIKKELGFR